MAVTLPFGDNGAWGHHRPLCVRLAAVALPQFWYATVTPPTVAVRITAEQCSGYGHHGATPIWPAQDVPLSTPQSRTQSATLLPCLGQILQV
eukprot:364720-Chlamydomonas_euryale.AAC.1